MESTSTFRLSIRTFVTGKIHRATVTSADLGSQGSITIDKKLMQAAGILPFELVHVNSFKDGSHWETYALPGKDGEIALNGPPANLFHTGDKVVINRLEQLALPDYDDLAQTVVQVDDANEIRDVIYKKLGTM